MITSGLIAPAVAQSSGAQWFVPKTAAPAATSAPARTAAPAAAAAPATAQVQISLPAMPALPQLPQGSSPPAAVIGVLDLTGVLRSSTAYQAVQKEMTDRQNKLNSDAQTEQAAWREQNQEITDQQKTLTADQLSAKQAALQDRISNAEKLFKARDQRNQDAANYAYEQINQVLNNIVAQVAQSRGMNLVLSQTSVILNVREFDISTQVAAELNQVLSSVQVPPDGADVAEFARAHQAKASK